MRSASLFTAVVTTIQGPTGCLLRLSQSLRAANAALTIVGDTKTPADFALEGADFLSVGAQLATGSALAAALPKAHYARKNIGYVAAMRAGATMLYETDDDNAPLSSWSPRAEAVSALPVRAAGWVNVYKRFTSEPVWPRGLPLDAVRDPSSGPVMAEASPVEVRAPIQQGLANGEPDVDAVWRLVTGGEVVFESRPSVALEPGAWCPFNSQSTWWFPVAYPLLYLPSYCSFRMTDIWRSFVAQRCLWELGLGVVFHGPEVVQERNTHNLMRDFEEEVPGYLGNRRLATVLEGLSLEGGEANVGRNLARCYEALIGEGFFPAKEEELVTLWLEEISQAAPRGEVQR